MVWVPLGKKLKGMRTLYLYGMSGLLAMLYHWQRCTVENTAKRRFLRNLLELLRTSAVRTSLKLKVAVQVKEVMPL